MAMQFYTSPEQIMRDRSEYARKNISRGRNVVVLSCADGVLFVAENVSASLHKVYELYDRIGFAAIGKYNEFENLRTAGVRMADLRGYAYDRSDVTAASLAKAYAQTLGTIFTEQTKPFEVELCVAQVGSRPQEDELYQLTFDGVINPQPGYFVMGGQADQLVDLIKEGHSADAGLAEAFRLAVNTLSSNENSDREITTDVLEVALLERSRPGRAFRRITGTALEALMPQLEESDDSDSAESTDDDSDS